MNPEPWVLLQLSTAAGAEVMHGAARLLHPATLLLSGHGRHKGKDVCSNLSQKGARGHGSSPGCKQLRLCRHSPSCSSAGRAAKEQGRS